MPALPPGYWRWTVRERTHWIRQAMGTIVLDLYDALAERQGVLPSEAAGAVFLGRVNGVLDAALRWRDAGSS